MTTVIPRKWTPKTATPQPSQKNLYKNPPDDLVQPAHPPAAPVSRAPMPAASAAPSTSVRPVPPAPRVPPSALIPPRPAYPTRPALPTHPAFPTRTAPSAAPPVRVPRRPLAEVEIFQLALALYPQFPEQPATLRREALELIATLGGGLICGEPERLLQALGDSRVAVGRISALAQLLTPALGKELDPALHQLNRSLGYFARYLRNQQS